MAAAKVRAHDRSKAETYPPPLKRTWRTPRLERLFGSSDTEGKTYRLDYELSYTFMDGDEVGSYMRGPDLNVS